MAWLAFGWLALLLAPALPAGADGGPTVSDALLWSLIDEGQQIAVVDLRPDGTARVDLFISMADRSGQSHQVTFFVPLGVRASDLLLPLLLPALGLANAWLFARLRAERLGVTRWQAFGAYLLAVLLANALYLAFALAYGALAGAI